MTVEDDNQRFFAQRSRRPLWHRKRVSEGATWQPIDRFDLENKDVGIICKTCHKRIRYKDIDIRYESSGTDWEGDLFRLWWCTICGALLKEDNLTDMALAFELRRQQ